MSNMYDTLAKIIGYLYLRPFRKLMPFQTFRYAVCGTITAVAGIVFYYLSYHYIFFGKNLDLRFVVISPHVAAMILTFPVTFAIGFNLNKYVAFTQSPLRSRTQLIRYFLSVSGSVGLNYACIKVFVEAFHFYPTPSQALATVIVAVYSYLVQKYFTFRGCLDL